ncbi:hypothetical protein FRAHR75_560008 [Frankia sp. Hr75.2]|nr:hypothetical protein FRAHR75_560008 [Frankia sp. Hr75.2]
MTLRCTQAVHTFIHWLPTGYEATVPSFEGHLESAWNPLDDRPAALERSTPVLRRSGITCYPQPFPQAVGECHAVGSQPFRSPHPFSADSVLRSQRRPRTPRSDADSDRHPRSDRTQTPTRRLFGPGPDRTRART